MNYEIFKSILAKSNQRILFVGILLFFIGTPILIYTLLAKSSTAAWIISLLFMILGVFVIIRSVNDLLKIKSDTFPLLNAITQKQSDYIVWIYQKEITSKVEGVEVGKSNNVVVWTNNNKNIEIVLSKRVSPSEVIQYLSTLFPKAYVGYSDEIKKEVELALKNNNK